MGNELREGAKQCFRLVRNSSIKTLAQRQKNYFLNFE